MPLSEKTRFLGELSEDDFRDRVVRPLFLRIGLRDGRDNCGPTEAGKDAIFVFKDAFDREEFWVVQTKRGAITLGADPQKNLLGYVTQMRTALDTKIPWQQSRKKSLPARAILCISGKLSDQAKQHIIDALDNDKRLDFLDCDDLIPRIDDKYPELWLGIFSDVVPYLRSIRRLAEDTFEAVSGSSIPDAGFVDAATDAMFVQLRLHHHRRVVTSRHGKVEADSEFEDVSATTLLERPERLILVLGSPGSGKSTILRRLAYISAEKGIQKPRHCIVPVAVKASSLVSCGASSFVEVLLKSAESVCESDTAPFNDEDLQHGRVLVLIDAFDEIGGSAARTAVLENILEFHKQYGRCMLVLASREYS
ncbi:MAG: NACHT domain-containing protein, partial [Verrucomicrobiae bacterium]|nr:NACHT domain-containing protein [Verrucomicrobiae bacterium]